MMDEKKVTKQIRSVRDLEVYRLAFDAAMDIFKISKSFFSEERFVLIDQIRRSSRSVCSNLAEGWRKRMYKAMFLNKLSDASQEASETQTWLEFALRCGYLSQIAFEKLDKDYEHIFAMLTAMDRKADAFCRQVKK
jgi:four helix bundle protein